MRYFLIAAAIAATAGSASAQFTENFSGLTTTTIPAGSSTFPGATISEPFAPGAGEDRLLLVNDGTSDHPRSTDTQYIQTSGNVGQYFAFNISPGLPLTSSTVQVAIPIRVDSLDTTSTLDVFRVLSGGTASSNNLFGLVVSAGTFRLSNSNGVGSARVISTSAFDPAAPLNVGATTGNRWNDGKWRTLLVRQTLGTSATGAVRVWVQRENGTQDLVLDASGITNTQLGAAGVTRVALGASFAAAPLLPNLKVSYDNITFYNTPSESAFLAAAAAQYGPQASVRDWSMY